MQEDQVKEALRLMSKTSRDVIESALHASFAASIQPNHIVNAFNSPSPSISASDIHGFRQGWQPEQQSQLSDYLNGRLVDKAFRVAIFDQPVYPPSYKQYELYKAFPDGTRAMFEVPPRWGGGHKPSFDEGSIRRTIKFHDSILKASDKVGIPKTAMDMSSPDLKPGAVLKVAVVRQAVANGAGVNVAMAAAFNVKMLFQGEFKKYFSKLGSSALHGGLVAGGSAYIKHPIFGHSAVCGLLATTTFSFATLVITGDSERFGKDFGLSALGTGGGWVGAEAGALVGSCVGPLGTLAGGVIGGLVGSLGVGQLVKYTTNLCEMTDQEVDIAYKAYKDLCAQGDVEIDTSLSPRETVKKMMDGSGEVMGRITGAMAANLRQWEETLCNLRTENPKGFEAFLKHLRATVEG